MKIVITEANTKNSIAIQKELSINKNLYLIAHCDDSILLARLYGYCNEYYSGKLENLIEKNKIDFIIPVGAPSVKKCSDYFRDYCLLPSKSNLEICFNKSLTSKLNIINGVNYPKTYILKNINDFNKIKKLNKKYVIKSLNESNLKFDSIYYSKNEFSDEKKILNYVNESHQLIAQEFIDGVGRGFFCIANKGKIITYYMHERIREIPITGGSSTAAISIFCPDLLNVSEKIITHLNWSGPLMIEFKYNKKTHSYNLIELNPKFWGSLDLSYSIGLKFGSCLLNVLCNKKNDLNNNYLVGIEFYWILDGDLLNIIKYKNFSKIKSYFHFNSRNNLSKRVFAELYKLLWNIKKLI